jgi:hypothetical protein
MSNNDSKPFPEPLGYNKYNNYKKTPIKYPKPNMEKRLNDWEDENELFDRMLTININQMNKGLKELENLKNEAKKTNDEDKLDQVYSQFEKLDNKKKLYEISKDISQGRKLEYDYDFGKRCRRTRSKRTRIKRTRSKRTRSKRTRSRRTRSRKSRRRQSPK